MDLQAIHILEGDNLAQRHLESCARDIAKLATLVVTGNKLCTAFTRRAATSRRYNREYLPEYAINVDTLFSDVLLNHPQNFMQAFERAQRCPRMPADLKSYTALVDRVLSDSSPYLEPVMHWMERNRTTGGFAQYMDETHAIRLLRHRVTRTEEELETLIRQGMKKLRIEPGLL